MYVKDLGSTRKNLITFVTTIQISPYNDVPVEAWSDSLQNIFIVNFDVPPSMGINAVRITHLIFFLERLRVIQILTYERGLGVTAPRISF